MITEIISFAKNNAGATAGGGGLLGLLAVRFLPAWLADLKERRLEALRERIADKQEYTNREHDLMARLDRKEEVLEKLTSNHIQHLEIVLDKQTAFFTEATKTLAFLNEKTAQASLDHEKMKDDLSFLRGKLS